MGTEVDPEAGLEAVGKCGVFDHGHVPAQVVGHQTGQVETLAVARAPGRETAAEDVLDQRAGDPRPVVDDRQGQRMALLALQVDADAPGRGVWPFSRALRALLMMLSRA